MCVCITLTYYDLHKTVNRDFKKKKMRFDKFICGPNGRGPIFLGTIGERQEHRPTRVLKICLAPPGGETIDRSVRTFQSNQAGVRVYRSLERESDSSKGLGTGSPRKSDTFLATAPQGGNFKPRKKFFWIVPTYGHNADRSAGKFPFRDGDRGRSKFQFPSALYWRGRFYYHGVESFSLLNTPRARSRVGVTGRGDARRPIRDERLSVFLSRARRRTAKRLTRERAVPTRSTAPSGRCRKLTVPNAIRATSGPVTSSISGPMDFSWGVSCQI